MPSFLIPGIAPTNSGLGTNLLSGNFWSGLGAFHPVGGVQLKAAPWNSGNVYVTLSGGITITSGGFNTSGCPNMSGAMDGMLMGPGDGYFIPKLSFNYFSGAPQLWVAADAGCSGQARLFAETF